MNDDYKKRTTNNPYLMGLSQTKAGRISFGSELKRLCGHPARFLATLLLVVIPAAAALAGALDLLTEWLYKVSHHTGSDPRPTISLLDCASDQTHTLCQGIVWASPASSERLVLYPWHDFQLLRQWEPQLFVVFFAIAVIAFAAIGNPVADRLGNSLGLVFGLRGKAGEEGEEDGVYTDSFTNSSSRRRQRARTREKARNEHEKKKSHTGEVKASLSDLDIETFSSQELAATLAKAASDREAQSASARGKDDSSAGADADKIGHQFTTLHLLKRNPTGARPRALLDLDRVENFWKENLLIGSVVPRRWEKDPGYFWLDKKALPAPYWLTLNMLRTGLVIVAPQGSGKTASIFKPLRRFMENSRSAGIFYDVKSSENANGTGTDFPPELFELNFDASWAASGKSIKLNLFAGQTPAQAGERLAEALIPDLGGDKAYFSNNAKSAMSTIVACYHAMYGKFPTLVKILNFLNDANNLEDLFTKIDTNLVGSRREEGVRLTTLLRRVISLGSNKNTDTLGNLATALEPLVTDVAASLLVTNPEPGAYTVEELIREPRLVRLALPVANNPRIYPIIGRLVLAQFTYAVLSPDCNRQIFKLIAADEARFFITDSVATGMAQARSSNAGFALSFQTLTQVRDEVLLDNIFANAGSKLVMGKVSDKDAERYSRLFGTIELPYVSHSHSASHGTNKNSGHSYSRGLEFEMLSSGASGQESRSSRSNSSGRSSSEGNSEGTNLITRSRRRFFDSEIREAPQRYAIVESSDDHGQQWFGQVVNMDAAAVRELEDEVKQHIAWLLKNKKSRRGNATIVTGKIKSETGNPDNGGSLDPGIAAAPGSSLTHLSGDVDEEQEGKLYERPQKRRAKFTITFGPRVEQAEEEEEVEVEVESETESQTPPGPRPRIRAWSIAPSEKIPLSTTPAPATPVAVDGTSVPDPELDPGSDPVSRTDVEARVEKVKQRSGTPGFENINALNEAINRGPKLVLRRRDLNFNFETPVTNQPTSDPPIVAPGAETQNVQGRETRGGKATGGKATEDEAKGVKEKADLPTGLDKSQSSEEANTSSITTTSLPSQDKIDQDQPGERKPRRTGRKTKVVVVGEKAPEPQLQLEESGSQGDVISEEDPGSRGDRGRVRSSVENSQQGALEVRKAKRVLAQTPRPQERPEVLAKEKRPGETEGAIEDEYKGIDNDKGEGEGTSLDDIFEINELLLSIEVKPDLVKSMVKLMVSNNRTSQDLRNLILFARNKNVEGLGSYVVTMISSNRFPGPSGPTGTATATATAREKTRGPQKGGV